VPHPHSQKQVDAAASRKNEVEYINTAKYEHRIDLINVNDSQLDTNL
jgi:hypothetical protein